jgi:hypothetical protein
MPDEPIPLRLDDEIADAVRTAPENGRFVTVAYVGGDGYPHLSYRGSTHVCGPRQIAVWARSRDTGLAAGVRERPETTLFLRVSGQTYVFYGRARVSADPAEGDRVYEAMPQGERDRDPEKRGVAVIVELERVEARGERNFVMAG